MFDISKTDFEGISGFVAEGLMLEGILAFIGVTKLLYGLSGTIDVISRNPLTCTSTGPVYYIHPSTGELVTVPAGEPLNHPILGITSLPAFSQFLATPLTPVNQTTASLGIGEYFLWLLGDGSVAVSANTATTTNTGSATEAIGINFQVTIAGTVDVVITGECTTFQIIDKAFSLSPFLNNSTGTIASRAGTVKAAGLAANFPKLYDALDTGGFKMSGTWTPGQDYTLWTPASILTGSDINHLLQVDAIGGVVLNDEITTVALDIDFIAGTPYPWEIVAGYGSMQINIQVASVWQSVIADFDGSFNPTTAIVFGLSNPYQSSIKNLKVETLKNSHWRDINIYTSAWVQYISPWLNYITKWNTGE